MPVTRPVLIQGERSDNHTKGEGLLGLSLDPHYHNVQYAIQKHHGNECPWIGEKSSWILDSKATLEGGIITFDCQKERGFCCLWPDPGWEEEDKELEEFPSWTKTNFLFSSTAHKHYSTQQKFACFVLRNGTETFCLLSHFSYPILWRKNKVLEWMEFKEKGIQNQRNFSL